MENHPFLIGDTSSKGCFPIVTEFVFRGGKACKLTSPDMCHQQLCARDKKRHIFFDASGKFDIKQGIHKIFMSSEMLDTVSSKLSEKCLKIYINMTIPINLLLTTGILRKFACNHFGSLQRPHHGPTLSLASQNTTSMCQPCWMPFTCFGWVASKTIPGSNQVGPIIKTTQSGLFYTGYTPHKSTWNLKITCLKRKIIFQSSIFGFHVSFLGGTGFTQKPLI